MGRVDIITTTFGKALGGASGGCIAGHAELIEWYRQKSRPYLFSNTLVPAVVGGTIAVIDLLSETTELRDKLEENQRHFRGKMTEAGFGIRPGDHPIVPIMLYNAKLAQDFARDLLEEGIYVIGFSYPVVPKGEARIRVQLSAAHEREHVERAIEAFKKMGEKYGILGLGRQEIIDKYGM
jgi:glycine C-acetyltransferase